MKQFWIEPSSVEFGVHSLREIKQYDQETLAFQLQPRWLQQQDVVLLLRKAYANIARAYQRGLAEGERRERAMQQQVFWATKIGQEAT